MANEVEDKKNLVSHIVNTFGLSSAHENNNGASLDMFRRPVADLLFVVSQADTKSIVEGSLAGLISQWKTRFGQNLFADNSANAELYKINSDKYAVLAKGTSHARVQNFLRQLTHFENQLTQEYQKPTLNVVVFSAMRDLSFEEAVDARQLLQNEYIPKIVRKLNDQTQDRVVAQVVYDDNLVGSYAVGRKLAAYTYATVTNNSTKNNTNSTAPSDNDIAEWQAAVWTSLILIFAGIFAVKFIMSIDYSADQVCLFIFVLTLLDDLCCRINKGLLKILFVP